MSTPDRAIPAPATLPPHHLTAPFIVSDPLTNVSTGTPRLKAASRSSRVSGSLGWRLERSQSLVRRGCGLLARGRRWDRRQRNSPKRGGYPWPRSNLVAGKQSPGPVSWKSLPRTRRGPSSKRRACSRASSRRASPAFARSSSDSRRNTASTRRSSTRFSSDSGRTRTSSSTPRLGGWLTFAPRRSRISRTG